MSLSLALLQSDVRRTELNNDTSGCVVEDTSPCAQETDSGPFPEPDNSFHLFTLHCLEYLCACFACVSLFVCSLFIDTFSLTWTYCV
jgi:hypothetical protein